MTGPACRAGLPPDGYVSTDGWGALDSFSVAVSWAFLLLPRPRDSALQGFSNKIIHTVFSMLLSNHHNHPTSQPSHPSLLGSMRATCTALFDHKTGLEFFLYSSGMHLKERSGCPQSSPVCQEQHKLQRMSPVMHGVTQGENISVLLE